MWRKGGIVDTHTWHSGLQAQTSMLQVCVLCVMYMRVLTHSFVVVPGCLPHMFLIDQSSVIWERPCKGECYQCIALQTIWLHALARKVSWKRRHAGPVMYRASKTYSQAWLNLHVNFDFKPQNSTVLLLFGALWHIDSVSLESSRQKLEQSDACHCG